MSNLQKFIDKGSCREDLVLLGTMPTVTPTLWTTLATGAYPGTRGSLVYNLDSRRSKAEPLWNIFVEEADKRTLVWHWPGSSWPATSDSPNLHVVDGTQPQTINTGIARADISKIVVASEKFEEVQFLPNNATISPGAGCIIENVENLIEDDGEVNYLRAALLAGTPPVGERSGQGPGTSVFLEPLFSWSIRQFEHDHKYEESLEDCRCLQAVTLGILECDARELCYIRQNYK